MGAIWRSGWWWRLRLRSAQAPPRSIWPSSYSRTSSAAPDNPDEVRGKNVVVVAAATGGGGHWPCAGRSSAMPLPGLLQKQKFLGANKKNLSCYFRCGIAQRSLYPRSGGSKAFRTTLSVQRKAAGDYSAPDAVYVLIGSSPSRQFLQKIGIVQEALWTTATLVAKPAMRCCDG